MRIKRLPTLITRGSGSTVVLQVANGLREAIYQRKLATGEALPSSRDLAEQLGVARNTVLNAIALLVDAGLLETRQGAGCFVRPSQSVIEQDSPYSGGEVSVTDWAQKLSPSIRGFRNIQTRFNLLPGLPDLRAFPFDEWRRSAVRKLKTLHIQIGGYGAPEGDGELRLEIARYVARSRGIVCDAEDVIVTSGAQQAFDLITRVLVRPGMSVAIESPGYQPATWAFQAGGATLHPVNVDADGLDVSRIPDDASIAYVTPSHQFPLGMTMSDARRHALMAWAMRRGAIVIEDDYDSEYRYTHDNLPTLRALGADCISYVGTFSKSLMPGIRLGYLVLPKRLRGVFIAAKCLVDWHSDNMSQAVLGDFMASGAFTRHVAKMRNTYAERHAALMQFSGALAKFGARLLPSQAGLHMCLLLPHGVDEAALIADAARQEISLYGLRATFIGAPAFPGLILGFGNIGVREIEQAMERLISILDTTKAD